MSEVGDPALGELDLCGEAALGELDLGGLFAF